MARPLLRSFLGWFQILKPAFTQPGFVNALTVMMGWIQTRGPHAVTQSLVETAVAGRRHHEAFHRFFSRGTWHPDRMGKLLFTRIVAWLLPASVTVDLVVDDTMVTKKGPTVFGLGTHLDPVRSSVKTKVFAFGHVWVVLSVVVYFPYSRRPWALPVLFRLYRSKKECAKNRKGVYFKKTELARQMLDIVLTWAPETRFRVSTDSAYANATVLRDLSPSIALVGSMRPDAVLTALPTDAERKRTGRRRKKGETLPKPLALAALKKHPWKKITVDAYGRARTQEYKTMDAQWYRGAGIRLLRIVVVRVPHGCIPIRVYFTTDLTMSVRSILETYAGRWSTEVCFQDLKQLLGFGDSKARTQNAVERTAPFVGYTYVLLLLWFATHGTYESQLATPPLRPWYPHKSGLCFADVLRCAQRVFVGTDVLDLANDFNDLCQPIPIRPPYPNSAESTAA
jgi:hypothetical protein